MKKNSCEICNVPMTYLWSFSRSPIVNDYKRAKYDSRDTESHIVFCDSCSYLKNLHDIDIKDIFHNYSYRSFDSPELKPIVTDLKDFIELNKIENVLEVGCNTGLLLYKINSLLKERVKFSGFDPAPIKQLDLNFDFYNTFFCKETLEENDLGLSQDFVIVRHAFAHNPNIDVFAKDISSIVRSGGYVYIENADLIKTLELSDWGQLYLEHFYALSSKSVIELFKKFGFTPVSVKSYSIHNGSFGVILKKDDKQESKNHDLVNLKSKEIIQDYYRWRESVSVFFEDLQQDKVETFLWGSTAKSTLVFKEFSINTEDGRNIFDGCFDFTPEKEDKFIPGTNIIIKPEPKQVSNKDIQIVLGARNFSNSIIEKAKTLFPNSTIKIPPF